LLLLTHVATIGMILKSGYRFSPKIMLNKGQGPAPLASEHR